MNTLEILGIVFLPLFWLSILSHILLLKAACKLSKEHHAEIVKARQTFEALEEMAEYWRKRYIIATGKKDA